MEGAFAAPAVSAMPSASWAGGSAEPMPGHVPQGWVPVRAIPSTVGRASMQGPAQGEATGEDAAGPRAPGAALAVAVAAGASAAVLRRRRDRFSRRRGILGRNRSRGPVAVAAEDAEAPSLPTPAPTTAPTSTAPTSTAPTTAEAEVTLTRAQAIVPSTVYERLYEKCGGVARTINGLPSALPMVLLSTYTALPLLAFLGYTFCPGKTRVAKILAGALGALGGTVAGEFLKRSKKEAARAGIFRILADNVSESVAVAELRGIVDAARRRFAVGSGSPAGEEFEDGTLADAYEALLSALLDGPEHEAGDLPALQRLKASLDLDPIVVGNAHRRAAQLLVSRGYSGLEGEPWRIAVDKLLFLSERSFSDDEPEEARIYEMKRILEVMRIDSKEARKRIATVSRAIYSQYLGDVADEVDAVTGEALAVASQAFGLPEKDAAKMNTETYRTIAADLLADGSLPENGVKTLERARGVLQLGDRAAALAFAAAAGPHLNEAVENVAAGLAAESVAEGISTLSTKQKDLGLSVTTTCDLTAKGFSAKLRSFYDAACRFARSKNKTEALKQMDAALAFATNAEKVLSQLREGKTEDNAPDAAADDDKVEAVPMTLPAEQASGRRLYSIYLERSIDGEAGDAPGPEEMARLLELNEADEEFARVEVCQPRLKALYTDSIEKAKTGGPPLNLAKLAIGSEMTKFGLPSQAVEETAKEVYKQRISDFADSIPKAEDKGSLDAALGFLDLFEADVRLMHLKAFGKVYENSVNESMGRDGIMTQGAHDALNQLRERLGLTEEDCENIFHGVVETRLKEMMVDVSEAWEEATYSKEALAQIWKERGKDEGDDVYVDGSGDELGITDAPKMEGVRGSKLMDELVKVSKFYIENKVLKENAEPDEMYPVSVGKYIEDKAKEEMYGVFAWNAVTCQDTNARAEWEAAKPHVAGILGLSVDKAQKVMNRMVSRWANMFIKQRFQEKGELGTDDVSTLTDWVPTFFGIDKSVTKDIVQGANKGVLQGKVMRLLNQPAVTPADLEKLRADVEAWDLRLEKDLELTKPQLRSLFRVEVANAIEDPDMAQDQKEDAIANSRESFGLEEGEAAYELEDMLFSRCRGCLVNAVGDLMQGNETQAMDQMQRLELLAGFCRHTNMELKGNWEVAPGMRRKLVDAYGKSAGSSKSSGREPDLKLLEKTLELS